MNFYSEELQLHEIEVCSVCVWWRGCGGEGVVKGMCGEGDVW